MNNQAQIAARAALNAARGRLATFLAKSSFDPQDNLARRALRAINKTREMLKNAYDRGDQLGFQASQAAYVAAVEAFAYINTEKNYDFTVAVGEDAVATTAAAKQIPNPGRFVVALVEQAEIVIERLADKLTAVCTVSGIKGVAILRGVHCAGALQGLVIANEN